MSPGTTPTLTLFLTPTSLLYVAGSGRRIKRIRKGRKQTAYHTHEAPETDARSTIREMALDSQNIESKCLTATCRHVLEWSVGLQNEV